MANIKISLDYEIRDGMTITFRAPCYCDEVRGILIEYPILSNNGRTSKLFTFKDANDDDVGHLDTLYTPGALIMVLLDVTNSNAYILNANTNLYLEDRLNTARGIESLEYPGCFYYSISLGMAETPEWINPPMVPGVEYRTTERFNGQPVYTMLVDCGSIFNSSDKSKTFSVDTPIPLDTDIWALRLVGVSGTVWGYLDTTKYSFYSIDNCPLLSKYEVAYNYDHLHIYLTTCGNDPHTNTTVYVTLKYIKEYL